MIRNALLCLVIIFALAGCISEEQPIEKHSEVAINNGAIVIFKNDDGGLCTGFYVSHEGRKYFVTARHAVEKNREGWSEFLDDVWVLRTTNYDGPVLELSNKSVPIGTLEKEAPRRHFPVSGHGYIANKYTSRPGYVCGRFTDGKTADIILTTVEMDPGMSGSPLLDNEGKVLGVMVSLLLPKEKSYDGMAKSACTPVERMRSRMVVRKNL